MEQPVTCLLFKQCDPARDRCRRAAKPMCRSSKRTSVDRGHKDFHSVKAIHCFIS
jgi:hypothetical protein